MTVRRLGAADLAAFREIRLEALAAEPAAFASSFEAWSVLSDAEWRSRLEKAAVFASFDDTTPIGITGLMPEPGPRMAHRGMLVMVYLRQVYRGQGRAEALLAAVEAEARARGVRQLELHVSAENPRAVRFYERVGFVSVGRLPAGYIHDGREVDEFLMVKRLAGLSRV